MKNFKSAPPRFFDKPEQEKIQILAKMSSFFEIHKELNGSIRIGKIDAKVIEITANIFCETSDYNNLVSEFGEFVCSLIDDLMTSQSQLKPYSNYYFNLTLQDNHFIMKVDSIELDEVSNG